LTFDPGRQPTGRTSTQKPAFLRSIVGQSMNATIAMRKKWLAVSATVLLLVLGCAVAQEKEKFPYATVGPSCAPWDGPATELHFSTNPLRCGQSDVIELTISFWRDLPLHDNQTFSLDMKSGWGGASYCKNGQQPCERATSGNVHLETFSQKQGAKGTYELTFPKLGRVSGAFRADWCRTSIRCG